MNTGPAARRPRLLVGLGNPLAGDDGVGWLLAERLAADSRLPPNVEALCGGADLLRLAPRLAGRTHVWLLDAATGGTAGELAIVPHGSPALRPAPSHAHHLSPVAALELLLATTPELAATRFTWLLVNVAESHVRVSPELSPALRARLPALVSAILADLAGDTGSRSDGPCG